MSRKTWSVILVVLVVVGLAIGALSNRGGDTAGPETTPGATSSGSSSSSSPSAPSSRPTAGASSGRGEATDPLSGLRWVEQEDLPREAQDALRLIDAGGPFRYDKDGSTFGNFEGILPRQGRGFYREYTVITPGSRDRGARRIVTGDRDTIFYWTADHYETFERIRR